MTRVNVMTDSTRGSRRVEYRVQKLNAMLVSPSCILDNDETIRKARSPSSKFRISRLARQIPDLSRDYCGLWALGTGLYMWLIDEEERGRERRGKKRWRTKRGAEGGECAAISRVSLVRTSTSEDCEIPLTGRGSGTVFPMMPAVLLRRRSPVLQQHRTRTSPSHAISPFSPAARLLRTINCPRWQPYLLPAVRP